MSYYYPYYSGYTIHYLVMLAFSQLKVLSEDREFKLKLQLVELQLKQLLDDPELKLTLPHSQH